MWLKFITYFESCHFNMSFYVIFFFVDCDVRSKNGRKYFIFLCYLILLHFWKRKEEKVKNKENDVCYLWRLWLLVSSLLGSKVEILIWKMWNVRAGLLTAIMRIITSLKCWLKIIQVTQQGIHLSYEHCKAFGNCFKCELLYLGASCFNRMTI